MTAQVFAPPGFAAWPERTIFPAVSSWVAQNLIQPDGPRAGEPFLFTDQQARFLAWWYAHDADGRWLYRRATLRMCKGWGKDPVAAIMALVELLGPSRVDSRLTAPWVDVAAVSKDQTRTTMRLLPQLLTRKNAKALGAELGKEIVYANGGRGVIQAVTSSPTALEGGRATLAIRNEVQYWNKANEGHAMAEVIDGNLAKSRDGAARAISFCNAHVPGDDSVGEREWDAWQAMMQGRTRRTDVLYYAVEAAPATSLADEKSLRAGLLDARGDSTWLDVDRLVGEVYDPRTTPSEARRKYLNQVVAAEDAFFAPSEWDACGDDTQTLADGAQVTLGFDGSKTQDHTALVATRVEDGCEFLLDHWDPEAYAGGEVPRDAVDAAVVQSFARFDVVAFYSDVHPWESYLDKWRDEFGSVDRRRGVCVSATVRHPFAWDMRARQADATHAAEHLHDEVVERRLVHDGNMTLAEHAKNARRRPNRWGVSFGKETRESQRKVDALAATMLSRLAYWDYLALPDKKKRRGSGKPNSAMFV